MELIQEIYTHVSDELKNGNVGVKGNIEIMLMK